MASLSQYKKRAILPLVAAGLALYYLLVFLPLAHKAASLDQPLQQAWRKLAASLDQTNATGLDFLHITNQLAETRQALAVFENTRQRAAARLELAPALRAKMNKSFQLIEFQNERSKQIDELSTQAKQLQVALDPAVLYGLPEHTVEVQEPAMLWAALSLTRDLLETALKCNVTAVHALHLPPVLSNPPPTESIGKWLEIPIELEFTASGTNALKLIRSLPLRTDELRAVGFPDAPASKGLLFIDRLIIKKQAPEKVDEVRVALRASGFVMRE